MRCCHRLGAATCLAGFSIGFDVTVAVFGDGVQGEARGRLHDAGHGTNR